MRNRLYWWLAYVGGACLGMLLLRPSGWYVLFGTWPGRLAVGAVIIAFAIFVCIVSQKDKRELAAHRCCRFSCRLTPTLSGIPKGEQRQITLSVEEAGGNN